MVCRWISNAFRSLLCCFSSGGYSRDGVGNQRRNNNLISDDGGHIDLFNNKWRKKATKEHNLMKKCYEQGNGNEVSTTYNLVHCFIVFCNLQCHIFVCANSFISSFYRKGLLSVACFRLGLCSLHNN